MTESAIRLLILIMVFVSVVLTLERGISWYRLNRVGGRAINARLALIARGFDRTAVMARLRRDTNDGAVRLPGFLAGSGGKLDAMLRGTGLGLTPARGLSMLVGAAVVVLLVAPIVAGVGCLSMTLC